MWSFIYLRIKLLLLVSSQSYVYASVFWKCSLNFELIDISRLMPCLTNFVSWLISKAAFFANIKANVKLVFRLTSRLLMHYWLILSNKCTKFLFLTMTSTKSSTEVKFNYLFSPISLILLVLLVRESLESSLAIDTLRLFFYLSNPGGVINWFFEDVSLSGEILNICEVYFL